MRRAALAISSLLAAASFPALAAEGGEGWMAPIWGVPSIAWQTFNLALVVVLFYFLLRKSLPGFFAGRAEGIRKELEKAVREKEAALGRLREVELKMSQLHDEVAAIEKAAAAAAEAEKVRILREAEAAKERIRIEAKEELERSLAGARRELRAYAAELVQKLAREEIRKGLTDRDEEMLMEEFLRKLEDEGHGRIG